MKKFTKLFVSFALIFTLCLTSFALFACDNSNNTITITKQFKTTYYVGEELDVSDGEFKYVDEKGTESTVVLLSSFVKDFDSSLPGTRSLKIEYNNAALNVPYVILPYDLKNGVTYTYDNQNIPTMKVDFIFNLINGTFGVIISANNQTDDYGTITKKFDEHGFIEYEVSYEIEYENDVTTQVGTIKNITKNSFDYYDESGTKCGSFSIKEN